MYTPNFHFRPQTPLVAAHRGSRGLCPENTLEAALLGFHEGAHFWELDVNYTKDRAMVVIHDDTLERTTNVRDVFPKRASTRVCDFTLEEIRSLDAGSWYAAADPFGRAATLLPERLASFAGLRVPTLEEALRLTKDNDWSVNVEIKDHKHLVGHDAIAADVIGLIRRTDMKEQVLLSSFQHRYLEESRALFPELATGALVQHTRPRDPVALCRALGASAYHPDRKLLAPGDLAACRDAGLSVNVWTVNTPEEAVRLVREGATGIITDFPAACLEALEGTKP